MDTVMDDEDEQINTKGLSSWLHPNFPQHVCSVSQQAKTEGEKKRSGNKDETMGRQQRGECRS